MLETHDFLVPDYYPDFQCKIGNCRHACCEGWPVSISMADYFHLVSVPCSDELRRRLDSALHICDNPTTERYAQICHRYDGNCGVRLPDGRCGLQAELGEEALSLVCRLYPRGIRLADGYECSCANSCEATLELFLHRKEPIRFIRFTGTYDMPPLPPKNTYFADIHRKMDIRMHLIHLAQDRRLPLVQRISFMGNRLEKLQDALDRHDRAGIDAILDTDCEPAPWKESTPTQEQLAQGLEIAEEMLEHVNQRSHSIHDFGESALAWFRAEDNPVRQYITAKTRFETFLPQWQLVFEHILVNHLFFEQFPFQDRPISLHDEFLGICAMHALLRFLCCGWLATHPSERDFIDVVAAAFRLIDHTSFDLYAAALFKELHSSSPKVLHELLLL